MIPQLVSAQQVVFFALAVLAFGTQLVALLDAARRRADAFVAAGKMTKQRWVLILAVASAIGFVSVGGVFLSPLNFLNILGFVAAAVYLVDVKPALQQVSGGRGGSRGVSGPW
jgi:Protein of unknown function (DUF2516)